MTTIVYKDKKIAVDKQINSSSSILGFDCKKYLVNVKGYDFISVTGIYADIFKLENYIMSEDFNENSFPDFEESLIILVKDGIVYEIQCGVKFEVNEDRAWGSGSDIARGAIFMGASAVQAVKAGVKYDFYTGGHVDVYDLNTKKIETV